MQNIHFQDYIPYLFHWILQVFLVVFFTLLLDRVTKRVLARLHKRFETTTKTRWDDAVILALRKPLSLLIWIVGVSFAADIIKSLSASKLFQAIEPIRELGVIAAFTWFLVSLVRNGEEAFLYGRQTKGIEVDQGVVVTIGKLLRISIFITAVLVALQTMGYSISGVLAFGGIGGIAIGFAAKDLLANFFGGLMLFLDRPFVVGDWIRSPDKDIEGVVEHISWRLTRIRTFDKRPLYVPNATFSNISVENPSRMTNRRIYETIGIRYEDAPKIEAIVASVRAMLASHPEIDTGQTLMVNFNSFAPSSLDFFIYTFTKTTDWAKFHEIKEDVLLKVLALIEEQGAEIAYPTSTLHLTGENPLMGPQGFKGPQGGKR